MPICRILAKIRFTGPNGALNCAAKGMDGSWSIRRVVQLDPELFEMLVKAGGEVEEHLLEDLIQYDSKGNFVCLMISKHAAKSHEQ
jgi:hypothetical protein